MTLRIQALVRVVMVGKRRSIRQCRLARADGGHEFNVSGLPKRDAEKRAPHGSSFLSRGHLSGERRLANRDQQVIADRSHEHIVLVLEPSKLSFQVAYSSLQPAQL
jgi:hypothetical protein